MDEFLVDEVGLDSLVSAVARIAGDVGEAMVAHDVAGAADLPVLQSSHSSLVARWQLGLATAQGALEEISASITACATAYRLTDDDQAVEFQGAIA